MFRFWNDFSDNSIHQQEIQPCEWISDSYPRKSEKFTGRWPHFHPRGCRCQTLPEMLWSYRPRWRFEISKCEYLTNIMCQIMIKQHCHRPQGNVMFSEAFVSHSVHRIGFPACITGHMTGGSASGGVCIQEGGLHPGGGSASSGVCIQEVHPRDLHLGDLHPGGFLTVRKRSLGQGNIFTCVCHSVHRGACVVVGGCAWLQGGHAWLLGGMRRTRQDTVNERAVRILLECILVLI